MGGEAHPVTVHRLAGGPLAVIRRQVRSSELARVVPQGCGLVWSAVQAQGAHAGRHVALYWDAAIRLEVGVELHGPFDDTGEIVRSMTPGGLVATTTHFGPYGGLRAAHDAVHRWSRANSRALAGPRWEVYGHWQNDWIEHPSRIRTDVYYLLQD